MWVHTRPRTEQENAILINLEQSTRITISKLGERWFIEAMIGTEAFPLATAGSNEEAHAILKHIFDRIHAGETALDLEAEREEEGGTKGGGEEGKQAALEPALLTETDEVAAGAVENGTGDLAVDPAGWE